MSWLVLIPGVVAILGSWRASVKASADLKSSMAIVVRENAALKEENTLIREQNELLRDQIDTLSGQLDTLREELGLRHKDETAGGGSLMHVAHEPITRKTRKP